MAIELEIFEASFARIRVRSERFNSRLDFDKFWQNKLSLFILIYAFDIFKVTYIVISAKNCDVSTRR